MIAQVSAGTAAVLTLNVALPGGTSCCPPVVASVTVGGTVTEGLLLVSFTGPPDWPATSTLPEADAPPVTELGDSVTDTRCGATGGRASGGRTTSNADGAGVVVFATWAEMVAQPAPPDAVVIEKVAVRFGGVTEIWGGTLASAGLLLDRATVTGTAAPAVNVTVPVEGEPLVTSVGERLSDWTRAPDWRGGLAPSATRGRPSAASPTAAASNMASV
jgi:hypothetical protein